MRTILLSFLLLSITSCQRTGKPPEPANEAEALSPVSDSIQMADFYTHMKAYDVAVTQLPAADTCYRFNWYGGWGAFDKLCSIYGDSTGYYASSVEVLNHFGERNDVKFVETARRIRPEDWNRLTLAFKQSGFWCFNGNFSWACADCNTNELWAVEGSRSKIIRWVAFNNKEINDALLDLPSKMTMVANFQESTEVQASYASKGDSLFVMAFLRYPLFDEDTSYLLPPLPNCVVQCKEGISLLSMHKRDSALLRKLYFVVRQRGQTTRKILIKDLHKISFEPYYFNQ